MMRKGITPIIAIIVLLLITIALAGAAFTFLQGYWTSLTGTAFTIPTGGAFCVKNGTSGVYRITLTVSNLASSDLQTSDFIIAQIDGTDATSSLTSTTIPASGSAVILSNYDCGGSGCGTGAHTVTIGTQSNVENTNVFC